MRDQNKGAVLIEAVIAGGLIAIGLPTGQVPLLTLAAAATSIGCNWTHSLAERAFQYWCSKWFTDDGVLNHDITKALYNAFEEAVRQVEYDWKQHRRYLHLQYKSPEEAQLTLDALRMLREDGASFLLQHNHLTQVAQQEQYERVLSFLSYDEFKASEYLKPLLSKYLYGHDDELVTFVTEQLGPKWIFRFLEILKDPSEEGTRAWRAVQLLWQQSLVLSLNQIQQMTAETADTAHWLQEWAHQLKDQPTLQRNTIGQDALEQVLHTMSAQLSEIQAATKRIEKTTWRIETQLEEIRQKVALAEINPPRIWNVPYRRNPFFTGREDILLHLRETLLAGEQPVALAQPQAISGLGGIGKTQTAVEYANRYRDAYQAVFWARAESRDLLTSDFLTIAALLELPQQQEEIVRAVVRWLDNHERWLLILDNADELDILEDFLPSVGRGHVLLTTRVQSTGTLAQRINLEKMSLTEGIIFLLRRIKRLKGQATVDTVPEILRTQAQAIVEELDGLPLALDQAGAYIEETGCSLGDYLTYYKKRRRQLLRVRGKDASGHPEPVATTWSLTFERIEQVSSAAADLLRVCAFLHPDEILEAMIIEGASKLGPLLQAIAEDELEWNEAIGELHKYSLVKRDPEGKILNIHRLVQAVIRDGMDEQMQRLWAERTIRAVNAAFPDVEVSTWQRCERALPHALQCARLIETYTLALLEAARLLNQTGKYLWERGQYAQAEPLLKLGLATWERAVGSEHPDTARNLNDLAELYHSQGRYAEAESLFQRALAIREQVLGPLHPDTASSLNSLAALYHSHGKYAEAEPLSQHALAIREQVLGPLHPDTALSLNHLALLYYSQGKYTEAESLFQRALAIREQVLGPLHPDTAHSLNHLAYLYDSQGKYTEAESLFQRALAIREQVLGPLHPDTARSLNDLAALYHSQGKYTEAESLFQHALAIREQVLGPLHPDTAHSLNDLAELYHSQGRYAEAEPLFQRALAIREQVLGPLHPDSAASLINLAALYHEQGKYKQAEPLYQHALQVLEKTLGPEHPDVAIPLNGLANLYREQFKYEQAEPLYQRALTIRQRQRGSQHPETAESLHDFARFHEERNQPEEALSLYLEALAIREQQLGSQHPRTIDTRIRAAQLSRKSGQLDIYKQKFGSETTFGEEGSQS